MNFNIKKWWNTRDWATILSDFIFVLIMTVFPTLCFLLLGWLFSINKFKFSECFSSGEFFLYSQALLSSAYILKHNPQKHFVSFIIILLLFASSGYVMVHFNSIFTANAETIKMRDTFVFIYSIVSLIISAVVYFFSLCAENILPPNARQTNESAQDKISKGLQ